MSNWSYTVAGRERSTGTKVRARAEQIAAKARTDYNEQGVKALVAPRTIPTLAGAAKLFLAQLEKEHEAGNKAFNTLRHYRNAWDAWLDGTAVAKMRVDLIRSAHINALSFPGGEFTRKNARQAIGCILNWCVEQGWILAAPKIKSTRVTGRKIRITHQIEQALRAHMKRDVSDVFTVMLDDVMRNCEVFSMEWERVDWDGERYHVAKSKSPASQRTIPLSKRVMAMLTARKATAKNQWVFPSRVKKCGHVTTVAKQFRAAREAAGIPAEVKLYCSRHTGASELAEMGVDLLTLRELLGHEDISTTNKYLHGEAAKARGAINSKQRDRSGIALVEKSA